MATVTITVGQGRAGDLHSVLDGLLDESHEVATDEATITVVSDDDAFGPIAAMAHDWGFASTTDVSVAAEGYDAQAVTFEREPA